MNAATLKKILGKTLSSHNFIRKGTTWYLELDEVIVLVDLQASNYGEQFYVNLALWIKNLGDAKFPKEHKCPVRIRLNSVYDEYREELDKIFDLEDETLSDDERQRSIENLVTDLILLFVHKFGTIESLRATYKNGDLKKGLVSRRAQEFLA